MKIRANRYFRRRWLDFRNGHSIYLVFLLNLVNFVLIVYNFAIIKVPGIGGNFDFANIYCKYLP